MKLLILSLLFAVFGIAQASTPGAQEKPKEAQFEKDARSQTYTVRNFVKELEAANREIALLQAQITVGRKSNAQNIKLFSSFTPGDYLFNNTCEGVAQVMLEDTKELFAVCENGKWNFLFKGQIALLQAQITVLRQELQIAELPEVKSARCALAAEISADSARKKPPTVEKK